MVPLPIDQSLPQIVASLRDRRNLVIVAPPGAGKTTRVPPAVLAAGLLSREHPNLVILQPRRVAARASAQRIAEEHGWTVGGEVGYHIRFERRIGPATRLRVLTEGVLTRQLLDDPFLEGIGVVILDEFHERSLHTDVAIALLREVQQSVRPDLCLIVMSATLDAEPVARFLGDCPIIRTEGRTFPIDISYAPPSEARLPDRMASAVADAIASLDAQSTGDILAFLPGVDEIRRTMTRLEPLAERQGLLLLPLHGSLTSDDQILALRPADRRKVILATNIAETSLTIDGVRTVIDSGLVRVAGYDPQRGLDRLELRRISKASATQRAGRAGRTSPGRCIRLWLAREERHMADFESPEIERVDLASTVLALHAWGQSDPRRFSWFQPPGEEALVSAERLLAMLGALSSETAGSITDLGRRILALPVHPRLARLLLAAGDVGLLEQGAAIAALLSEKDILRPGDPLSLASARIPRTTGDSDLLLRLDLLAQAEHRRFSSGLRDMDIDPFAARHVAHTRDQLLRIAERRGRRPPGGSANGGRCPPYSPARDADAQLRMLPLYAYPDRVARRRGADPRSGVMVGGGGIRLAPESIVHHAEFFLALDARHDERSASREALVRIASAIDVQWLMDLFPQQIRRDNALMFDEARQRVVGRSVVLYRDLPLREDAETNVDPRQAGPILAEALRPRAGEMFRADEAAALLLARVALLRQHMSEHNWPPFDDAQLGDILADACHNKRTVDEVRRQSLAPLLLNHLPYPLDRLLDEHAPESVTVPSGSRIRLAYSLAQPPILAVRLQEIFGWTDTPRLAAGRIAVLLHLLGPNFRPVQITQDLRSFWSTTYFQVRKDLRIRYPRHSWPENPLTATPQAKGGRKR